MRKKQLRDKQRRERKAGRNHASEETSTLPKRFVPQFIESADGRISAIKEIRRRLKKLRADAGVDNFQKDILAQRAIFLAVQCETMETDALQGKPIDIAILTQCTNALSGLLTKLGLETKRVTTITLADKLKGRRASDD